MVINIRPYKSTDWPRLCEIHDVSRLDELALSVGTDAFLTLEQTADNEGLFDNKLFVAEVDHVVQGFIAYGDEELAWLYVDPKFYRKGVGRALVQHAVANSAPTMEIELLEGNTPALELYLSEGFKVIERVEGRLEGNEEFAAAGLVLRRENT
ncbi:gcn5 family acetyltransferase [Leptolyngbya sp. Heron Island J]|uniref:GNAT family N-acetyltransferase n=1 Tax=Leptolyngbya sp. Heron Island J TaxID=1385935 RepID=UPI0003B974FE|nr:GNAT family N-acetyltransferase [Leptolyngbya sp. Heron Island J]ESA33165.1 gcn5 family acetyltransferase [Leptolyngbya sp. Heron Island J]